jgi:hypothetical protein
MNYIYAHVINCPVCDGRLELATSSCKQMTSEEYSEGRWGSTDCTWTFTDPYRYARGYMSSEYTYEFNRYINVCKDGRTIIENGR